LKVLFVFRIPGVDCFMPAQRRESCKGQMEVHPTMSRGSVPIRTMTGWLAVFASAFFFYMATVTIRWSRAEVQIDSAYFVFARFALGFCIVALSLAVQRRSLRANRYGFLVGRTLGNTIAVFCFYKAVEVTTVANANILNMTYPIFVALIAWVFLSDQRDGVALVMVPVAFAGIWLIVAPAGMGWNWNNAWGLASGVSASVAIVYLNLCRRYDDAEITLFYMFGWGAVIIFLMFHEAIFRPNAAEFHYLLICSLFGVGGQYLLTYGFRFVTAVEGSVITSSRILLAAVLGPSMVADPSLTLWGWVGAVLIFAANVILAARKTRASGR
jgi:drug/metabolite transporter (DMT)-like permease